MHELEYPGADRTDVKSRICRRGIGGGGAYRGATAACDKH
jgi:hypothetical protein